MNFVARDFLTQKKIFEYCSKFKLIPVARCSDFHCILLRWKFEHKLWVLRFLFLLRVCRIRLREYSKTL